MRKILSLILVFIMLLSVMPVAYAASEINCSECGTSHTQCASCERFLFCDTCLICNECGYIPTTRDASQGTQVFFDAEDPDGDGNKDNMESWTVTVPARMLPAGTGNVIVSGAWASNRKLIVSADENVSLINDISKGDERILDVYFDGIELIGNNKASVSATKEISVEAMPSDALFGTWEGTFYYNVEIVNHVEILDVVIRYLSYDEEGYSQWTSKTYQFEQGMSWLEWINSEYNADELKQNAYSDNIHNKEDSQYLLQVLLRYDTGEPLDVHTVRVSDIIVADGDYQFVGFDT